jgi:hypothetical protein
LREDHEVGARFVDTGVVFVESEVLGFVEVAAGAEEFFDAGVEAQVQG